MLFLSHNSFLFLRASAHLSPLGMFVFVQAMRCGAALLALAPRADHEREGVLVAIHFSSGHPYLLRESTLKQGSRWVILHYPSHVTYFGLGLRPPVFPQALRCA